MFDVRETLKGKIEDEGFINWACERNGKFRFVVYQGMGAMEKDIKSLDLSVRAYNCLKFAGYDTVNSVVSDVDRREDLIKVRNIGRRGTEEVMLKLFLYTYESLKPEKKKAYLEKLKSMN